MKNWVPKSMVRWAAVAALGLGGSLGVVGAASASPFHDHEGQSSHHGRGDHEMRRVEGLVIGYSAGQSITLQTGRASTLTTYTLTSTTLIKGRAAGATLVVGDHVNLLLSNTTPVVVRAIRVQAPEVIHVEGLVTSYTSGASITVQTRRSSTPLTFTLTSSTPITGLATGVTLAVGDRVNLVLSSTVSGLVTSIYVRTPEAVHVRGVVTAYGAGASIAIQSEDARTPTTYTLTPATTIVGLATGVTLAVGDHVTLLLSSTTPVTVTSIYVVPSF